MIISFQYFNYVICQCMSEKCLCVCVCVCRVILFSMCHILGHLPLCIRSVRCRLVPTKLTIYQSRRFLSMFRSLSFSTSQLLLYVSIQLLLYVSIQLLLYVFIQLLLYVSIQLLLYVFIQLLLYVLI